eukprot:SAG22_NODE_1850_length_3446_cov_2.774425_2_plen_52_part_00
MAVPCSPTWHWHTASMAAAFPAGTNQPPTFVTSVKPADRSVASARPARPPE